jgi:hypothetical protein
MNVTFTKTAKKRYRVSIEGAGVESLHIEPAPGYNDRLPHDAAHMIVESELRIAGGIFGQLASGSTLGSFHTEQVTRDRKSKKRAERVFKENKDDALFSEHAVYAAQSRWEKHEIVPDTKIPADKIVKICQRFQAFADKWSQIGIGHSITLEWPADLRPGRKR